MKPITIHATFQNASFARMGILFTTLFLQVAIAGSFDQAKIQRGAKFFMNYCSGCHSLTYLRYSRLAMDLGLTSANGQVDKPLISNLIFTQARIVDPIQASMPQSDARQWFGIQPPDLSLIARERGPEWLYNYLQGFYADSSRPFGANNALVPDTAMPNVLAPLQQEKKQSPGEYDEMVNDLVSFLVYVSEPTKLSRYRIGWPALIFLAIFSALAYRLKKLYWKTLSKVNL